MKLYGQTSPYEQGDGYIPGAWDEVQSAFIAGHISEEAYNLLREALGDQIQIRPGDE